MKQFEEPIGPMGRLPKQELYSIGCVTSVFGTIQTMTS